jgi:hypothetical protein
MLSDKYSQAIIVPTAVKPVKRGQGRQKRLDSLIQKSHNFKGFGDAFDQKDVHWYCLEWKRETVDDDDLIELHWIKVLPPKGKDRKWLTVVMRASFENGVPEGFTVEDLLAAMYLCEQKETTKFTENGCNCAFMFACKKKGDLSIRPPIGQLYGSWRGENENVVIPYQSTMNAIIFKFVALDEIVPCDQVTLFNRKLKR